MTPKCTVALRPRVWLVSLPPEAKSKATRESSSDESKPVQGLGFPQLLLGFGV